MVPFLSSEKLNLPQRLRFNVLLQRALARRNTVRQVVSTKSKLMYTHIFSGPELYS